MQERAGVQTKWVRSEDDAGTVRGRVRELLAKPLGPQEAVQVALLNNPGLQAGYAEVGIAEADLVQASRWRGPTFSYARLRRGYEIERERQATDGLFGYFSVEERIPADHSLLGVKAQANAVLGSMSASFDAMYAEGGRPSVAPEPAAQGGCAWRGCDGLRRLDRRACHIPRPCPCQLDEPERPKRTYRASGCCSDGIDVWLVILAAEHSVPDQWTLCGPWARNGVSCGTTACYSSSC